MSSPDLKCLARETLWALTTDPVLQNEQMYNGGLRRTASVGWSSIPPRRVWSGRTIARCSALSPLAHPAGGWSRGFRNAAARRLSIAFLKAFRARPTQRGWALFQEKCDGNTDPEIFIVLNRLRRLVLHLGGSERE